MFHSGALLPRGASTSYIACKDELMASLTAVVTSGSPSASLRKTHGPGKVGPKEVFSFRRMSQASTSPIQSPVRDLLSRVGLFSLCIVVAVC